MRINGKTLIFDPLGLFITTKKSKAIYYEPLQCICIYFSESTDIKTYIRSFRYMITSDLFEKPAGRVLTENSLATAID